MQHIAVREVVEDEPGHQTGHDDHDNNQHVHGLGGVLDLLPPRGGIRKLQEALHPADIIPELIQIAAVELQIEAVLDRLTAEDFTVGLRRGEDQLTEIVVEDPGNCADGGQHAVVVENDLVTLVEPVGLVHAFGNQHAVLGLGHRFPVRHIAQVVPAGQGVRIRADQRAGAQLVPVGENAGVLGDADKVDSLSFQDRPEIAFRLGVVGVIAELGVKGEHLTVLPVNHAVLPEFEREAYHQQNAASGDADDGHDDACQIRAHVEQDQAGIEAAGRRGALPLAFFCLGLLTLHQLDRGGFHEAVRGKQHRGQSQYDAADHHDHRRAGEEASGRLGDTVVRRVHVQGQGLQHIIGQQDPRDHADQGRTETEGHVFEQDLLLIEAQGLGRSHKDGLLVHHARHGGIDHQGGDRNEQQREGRTERREVSGVLLRIDVAAVRPVVQNRPVQ